MPLAPDLTGSAIDQPTRADSLPEPIAADAIPQPIGQVPPPPPQPPSWDELQVALKNIGDEDKSHAVEAWRDNVSRYGYEKTAWSQDDEDRLQRFADEEQKKIASEVKFESGDKLYKQLANDFLTDPMRPGDALIQAYRDGVINRADNEQLKSAFEIQDQMRMQAEEQRLAGGNQKLKAVGVGAGRGLAFATGAVGGAKVAAFGTALIPVVGETVVAPIAAALVGGAIGGTITAAGYDELVRSNFESAMAASKLNPNYTAAGELGAFVIPGIAGVAKGIKRFALVAENLGRKEALNQAAKYVAVSGGIGAASAPVMSAIDRWKNSALDLGHEPQADLLDPKSIVANTVLAIMLGNLGVKFTKFNAGEAASIHQRGMAGQKLSPAEREMFDTINRKMAQNPDSFVFEAEQATFRNPKTGEQMPMSGAGAARTQRNSAQPQQPAGAPGGAVPPPAGGAAPPPQQGAPPPQQGRQQQQTGGQPPPPQTRAAPRRFNSQQEFNDFMDAASNRGDSVAGGAAWRTANVMGEKRWLPNWIKTNAQNNERSWFANSVLNAKSNADHAAFVVQQQSAASAKAAPKASAAAAGSASPPPVAGVPGGQQGRPGGVPGVPRGGASVVAAESAVPIAEAPKTTAALANTVVNLPVTTATLAVKPTIVAPTVAGAAALVEKSKGDVTLKLAQDLGDIREYGISGSGDGVIAASKNADGTWGVEMVNVTIPKKGTGSKAYIRLNEILNNEGSKLVSGPRGKLTQAALRMWDGLVRDGYAEKVTDVAKSKEYAYQFKEKPTPAAPAAPEVAPPAAPSPVATAPQSPEPTSLMNEVMTELRDWKDRGKDPTKDYFSNVESIQAAQEKVGKPVFNAAVKAFVRDVGVSDETSWNSLTEEDAITEFAGLLNGKSKIAKRYIDAAKKQTIIPTAPAAPVPEAQPAQPVPATGKIIDGLKSVWPGLTESELNTALEGPFSAGLKKKYEALNESERKAVDTWFDENQTAIDSRASAKWFAEKTATLERFAADKDAAQFSESMVDTLRDISRQYSGENRKQAATQFFQEAGRIAKEAGLNVTEIKSTARAELGKIYGADAAEMTGDIFGQIAAPIPFQRAKPTPAAPGATAQKMTWEMTKAEYNSARFNFGFQTKNLPETARLLREEGEQSKAELNNVFGQNARRERDAVLGPLRAAAETELDKMFGQGVGKRLTQSHEQQVSQALREGKPVPESVLADYPDLKPTPTAPAAPEPAPVVESVSSADAKAKQKKEQRDMFDEEFPPEGFRSFGGISMDEIFSAASKLYKAGMDFAGWAANMLKKLGEKIAPILRRIWRSLTGQDIKPEFRESGAIFGAGRRRRGRQPDALPQEERLLTTQGFYEGSADVFLKKPLFKFLGKAINKQVDLADKRLGDTTGKLEAWESRTGGAAQKEAKATLSDYIDARESGRTADAANILSNASPAATDLIKTIGEIAKYTGRVSTTLVQPNGRVGVEVVAAGGIRKLVNMGDKFWPRILKGNYDAVLRDPLSDPVMWQEMVTDLIANGNIATPAEAEQFLKGGSSNDAESDFLGSLYKGRAKERMPAKWYDTSLEGFEDWAVKWSDIVSKIEAFGQKIRPNDTNQFDEALKLTTFAPTQSFINSVASRAYNERNVGTAAKYLLDAPRLLASGLFLTNPVTIGINALSSKVMNTFTYGLAANFARNPLAMFSKNNNLDAFALGVLKRDMVRLLYRDDVPGLDALKNFTNGAMTISGYRSVENLTRVDSYLTALAFLHDGLGAVRRKPDSNAAMQFMAFLKRNGYDTAAIVRENGTGDATDTFLRGTVRDTQGGYAYNQVPWWTDTPLGRFMLQFSKFSTMFTRNVMRNVIEPAFVGTRVTVKVGGKTVSKRVFNVRPLLYFLLGSTLGGEAISFLKEKAFGIERRDATLEEIANTMDESTRDGLVLIAKRVVNDMLTMGMLGIFGTPIQSVKDVSEQTKMRNPLAPPGVSMATNVGNLVQSGWEQGKLTPEDVGDFLKSSVSMYRYGDAFVKEQSQNAGMEWESAQLKSRRDDAAFIRAASKRYAAEAGLPLGRATSAGRTAKSETTPMRRDLMDSLMTGNEGDARKTVTDYLSEFPSIAEKKEKLRSLQASVAQNQPVKVGGIAGNERRIEFMAWAKKNLSIADVARIEAVDQNYRKTANAIGLMTVPTAYQDERQSLKTAREIEKKEVKATEDENAEFFERNLKPQYKRRTQGMRLGL